MNNGKGNIGATVIEEETLTVEPTLRGFRVSSQSQNDPEYQVVIQSNRFVCDCGHFDDATNCDHIRAVLQHLAVERQERLTKNQMPERSSDASPATMSLRRSISPDGKIDSLSIEFTSPVDHTSFADIVARALSMLKLQSVVTTEFLVSKKAGRTTENQNGHSSQVLVANARMLRIGEVATKRDRPLFLEFFLEDHGARLFGTPDELAQAVADAGYSYAPQDICDGLKLDVDCQVLVKPARNPLYTEILKILPCEFSFPENPSEDNQIALQD